jgi:hypothetical protein
MLITVMMSLRKLSLVVVVLLLGVTVAHARQESNRALGQAAEYPNLKKQAQVVVDTFLAGDYKKFVTFVYPSVVRLAGGPEAMIEMISRGMRETDAKGFKLLTYAIGEPAPAVRIGQGLYAIVPTKMRMQSPHGVVVSESFMIGISGDSGENWTFVAGSGVTDEAQLRLVLPEAVGKLTLPEQKQPTLERNP